jgi:hypothetical protein
MSAFVISITQMDLVVTAICSADQVYGQHIPQFAGEHTIDDSAATRIGRALFAMNVDAVTQRYSAKDAAEYWEVSLAKTYTYTRPRVVVPAAAFKAMQCLQYQCSEGNVPESDLYRELEAAQAIIARKIVEAMPSYQRAAWGG